MYRIIPLFVILLLYPAFVQNKTAEFGPELACEVTPVKPMGYFEYVNEIAMSESSGNYWIPSPSGTFQGKYQFGPAALKDIGIDMYKIRTSKFHQERAMLLYLRQNKRYLGSYIEEYEGRVINGVRVTESGLLAASHLVGHDSVKRFLRTNGRTVRRDGNRVSLEIYLERYGGYSLDLDEQRGDLDWFSML